ncbi:precorrin-6A reductase [Halanaerobaculum tunisiense]
MILVLAGTKDSREIIKRLQQIDYPIIASVVTDYAHQLLSDVGAKVIKGKLGLKEMEQLIKEYGVEIIIDATHPFAQQVSYNALEVSSKLDKRYIRFERKEIKVPDDELVIEVAGYQKAAQKAREFERILLTIGSKNLDCFIEEIDNWQERLVARVLPNGKFIKQVQEIGFTPQNLIAIQGPFSKELNKILLKDYNIDLLVTKASGKTGGLDTKLEAALELEIPVLLITRPELSYPQMVGSYSELLEQL